MWGFGILEVTSLGGVTKFCQLCSLIPAFCCASLWSCRCSSLLPPHPGPTLPGPAQITMATSFSAPSALQPVPKPYTHHGSKQREARMTLKRFYNELNTVGAHLMAVQYKLLPDIINTTFYCPDCRKPLKKFINNVMRCGGKHTSFSYMKGSIFEGAHLSIETVLELCFFFSECCSYDTCIRHIFDEEKMKISEEKNSFFMVL